MIIAAVCVYATRMADPDLYGYLAYGRLFMERGGPIGPDPFSYTAVGHHWVAFEYLSQILFWLSYHLAGPIGLIGLKCLVGTMAVYFIYAATRCTTSNPFIWVPVFLLATSAVARLFLFRPQIFTFAFLAIYVAVLFRFLVAGSARLWILPIVMLAWANLHGGFLAGLGALWLTLALRMLQNAQAQGVRHRLFANTGRLILALLASTAVTVVNPQGWRLWEYVLTEVTHDTNRRFIAEWRPTLVSLDYWSAVLLTLMVVVLVILAALAHKKIQSVYGLRPWQWAASCIPLVIMGYLAVRHVPIAAIWIAPVLALLASSLKTRLAGREYFQTTWTVIAALATVPAVLSVGAVWAQPWPRIEAAGRTLGSTHPCTAVAFMREHHLSGNVYNPLWWGSYVTWHLYPGVRVSMDGRNISLFPDNMVLESLNFYSGNDAAIDVEAPLHYASDFLLIPPTRPVFAMIQRDPRWHKLFEDSDSALFIRNDAAHSPTIWSVGDARFTPGEDTCPAYLK